MIVRKKGSGQSQKPNMAIWVILGKSFKLLSPCFFIYSLKIGGEEGRKKENWKGFGENLYE